jgi:hypothetical protein
MNNMGSILNHGGTSDSLRINIILGALPASGLAEEYYPVTWKGGYLHRGVASV